MIDQRVQQMLSDLEQYRSVRETEEALAQVHRDRAEAIQQCLSAGATVSDVARALNVSTQRIVQLKRSYKLVKP